MKRNLQLIVSICWRKYLDRFFIKSTEYDWDDLTLNTEYRHYTTCTLTSSEGGHFGDRQSLIK